MPKGAEAAKERGQSLKFGHVKKNGKRDPNTRVPRAQQLRPLKTKSRNDTIKLSSNWRMAIRSHARLFLRLGQHFQSCNAQSPLREQRDLA